MGQFKAMFQACPGAAPMYVPPAFREDDLAALHATMREVRLANFVTATDEGLVATPLPLLLAPEEGPYGTLYGHLARANPQWRLPPTGDAMALFQGPDAYVTPSWYPSKLEHGKVVPTWNYVAVHAYGPAEFFEDADRLLGVVTRLTDLHERSRAEPWAVTDAPEGLRPRAAAGDRRPADADHAPRGQAEDEPEPERRGPGGRGRRARRERPRLRPLPWRR